MAPVPTDTGSTPADSSSKTQFLTPSQVSQFHRDGYLVLPGFFDAAPILQHAKDVIAAFNPEGHPMTRFSTGGDDGADAHKHIGDEYFLSSGSKISYFLEEGAVGPDGKLTREKELSINKCGHALHALDETFAKFSFSDKVSGVAKSLAVHQDPLVLQSMIVSIFSPITTVHRLTSAPRADLQTTLDRRRRPLPQRQYIPIHRPTICNRLVVRIRGLHKLEWVLELPSRLTSLAERPSAAQGFLLTTA